MKKIASIVLASLYLVLSLGISFQAHYCMGKLKSVDHVLAKAHSCCGDDAQDDNDCCDEELISLNLSEEQLIQNNQLELNQYHFVAQISEKITVPIYRKENIGLIKNTGPPGRDHPSYLMNCSFVFYG